MMAAVSLSFPVLTIRRGLKLLVLRQALTTTSKASKPIFSLSMRAYDMWLVSKTSKHVTTRSILPIHQVSPITLDARVAKSLLLCLPPAGLTS